MNLLIEELKTEHSEILDALNKVKALGILSKEGEAKLMSVREHLLAHLKVEDDQLYPTLRKEAEHNKHLKWTLDLFAMDMENVSKIVLEFFDKFSKGDRGEGCKQEFEDLLKALKRRIDNEEDSLYEEYEYLNK